jgi:hypothetical protein
MGNDPGFRNDFYVAAFFIMAIGAWVGMVRAKTSCLEGEVATTLFVPGWPSFFQSVADGALLVMERTGSHGALGPPPIVRQHTGEAPIVLDGFRMSHQCFVPAFGLGCGRKLACPS